jgi:hypothetical protein
VNILWPTALESLHVDRAAPHPALKCFAEFQELAHRGFTSGGVSFGKEAFFSTIGFFQQGGFFVSSWCSSARLRVVAIRRRVYYSAIAELSWSRHSFLEMRSIRFLVIYQF